MSRIAIIGPLDPDSFADNLVATAKRLGHDVLGLGSARPRVRRQRVKSLVEIVAERSPRVKFALERKLVDDAVAFAPEVVVSVDRRVSQRALHAITAGGARSALWFPDPVHNLGRHDVFLAGYDRLFFKNPILAKQLTDVYGLPAVYLPEGANPAWHRPLGEYGTSPEIVMAGNIHPTRAILVDRLLAAGVPVRIFGTFPADWIGFPRVRAAHARRYIAREEKSRIFRSAIAVLNNLHPAEFAGANCRLFEATAAGAVVLTESRPGMESLFEYGREVLKFESFDELVAHYHMLVAEPDRGRAIADAAAVRAARDHTWDQRLEQLLSSL